MALEESRYAQLADTTLNDLLERLDAFDPDEVEGFLSMGVLKVTFGDGAVSVINSHGAARQIWMAFDNRAWHFDWHEDKGAWLCSKTSAELYGVVSDMLTQKLEREVRLEAPKPG